MRVMVGITLHMVCVVHVGRRANDTLSSCSKTNGEHYTQ